jgi:hypothetical protein
MNIPPKKGEGKILVPWVSDIPKIGLVLGPFILGLALTLGLYPTLRKPPTERFQNFI